MLTSKTSFQIPSYTSDPDLKSLSEMLNLVLKLSHLTEEDCKSVNLLTETAFQTGYVKGLEAAALIIEASGVQKTLDKVISPKVN